MRILVLIAVLLTSTAAVAQEDERGRDLMAEALRLFMQGFMAEMEPAIEDLEGFLQDFNAYHPPEVLPNGDIIIRRKTPAELDAPEDVEL